MTEGDIVIWCDADISQFGTRFVTGLLGPLLCEPDVDFAKGYYHRPEFEREGGGRVTELVARPLMSLLFPELTPLVPAALRRVRRPPVRARADSRSCRATASTSAC